MNLKFILSIGALALFAACGDDSSSNSSADPVKNDDPMSIFEVRKPDSVKVSYTDEDGKPASEKFMQQDWICTFNYEGEDGYFYIQSSVDEVEMLMSVVPVSSETEKAELYVNGKMVPVSKAEYSWGGNHHNDNISFTYKDKVFKFYHSSFGFGWRSCQEMDCLQVFKADGETEIKDGCTSERSLPVACRNVDEKGRVSSFDDTFEKCPGDFDD